MVTKERVDGVCVLAFGDLEEGVGGGNGCLCASGGGCDGCKGAGGHETVKVKFRGIL